MKNCILFSVLLISSVTYAQTSKRMSEECAKKVNQTWTAGGFGAEQVPFFINSQGKAIMVDQSKIVSNTAEGKKQTIVYKVSSPIYEMGFGSKKATYNNFQYKLEITRDENGLPISIKRIEISRPSSPIPMSIAGQENKFKHRDGSCTLNQVVNLYSSKTNKNNYDAKVQYDNQLCSKIKDLEINTKAKLADCSNLDSNLKRIISDRNTELSKNNLQLESQFTVESDKYYSLFMRLMISCAPGYDDLNVSPKIDASKFNPNQLREKDKTNN